ncbi:MAG TPA: hypothetical protein VN785_08390 [Candidatus Angelobacter sp.]|nr:hypothetical protein [Candidatus Angelobacter sp.]
MQVHFAAEGRVSSFLLPSPPDEGFWDYLGIDEANHHLFVSHSDEILVISTDTNQVVGKLAPTPRSHGVIISRKDNHGYYARGFA